MNDTQGARRAARVLLIEDNPANLELMSYLLSSHGYEVLTSITGEAGLKVAGREDVDIVICDVQLPGIDGTEVVQHLKAEPSWRAAVVAVTALAMVGDRDRIMAAGFDGYLSKPLDPASFVRQIEAYLPTDLRSASFPVDEDPLDTPMPVRATPCSHSVLVVDDVPSNAEVLRSTLEPSGYRVVVATNGEEALRLLDGYEPDLIVSDLHLAGEPDFDFLERVKKVPTLATIPFIFLSSTSETPQLVDVARDKGAQAFLFGPVGPQTLLTHVAAALERQ